MSVKQSVMLKGQRDGITITLDRDIDFETLKGDLRRKVSTGRRFFEGANTNVSFQGRDLSEKEEEILIDIILAETNLDVSFVASKGFREPPPKPPKHTEPEPPPKPAPQPPPRLPQLPISLPASFVASSTLPQQNFSEMNATFYRGGLRSGQSIKFDGSVIVMGDVNPGSEIVAGGNVVVLGTLKGMAHAGASGDTGSFVFALSLRPTQLRIADKISHIPAPAKGAKESPSYAYVKDGQVFVAQI